MTNMKHLMEALDESFYNAVDYGVKDINICATCHYYERGLCYLPPELNYTKKTVEVEPEGICSYYARH